MQPQGEPFDPKTKDYPFPLYTDQHYLIVKKNDGTVFDEHYPYVDTSKKMRFKMWLARILLFILVFPLERLVMGLKVEGKENLKKHPELLKGGAVSISNHVHKWDYVGARLAVKRKDMMIPVWAPNIRGENGKMIRLVGGFPLPENDPGATATCFRQVIDYLNHGGWLHICAEGSMWEYYQPIRPFKRGAAFFAVKCDKPVVPMAYVYRKASWIRKLLFKAPADFTLRIGEPIYPDKTLKSTEAQTKLLTEAHAAVCRLAGIAPEKNLYPPIFDHTTRVDYY